MSTFIDADAHIDECEETWSYLPKEFQSDSPKTLFFKPGDSPSQMSWNVPDSIAAKSEGDRFWFIDGQIFKRIARDDERTGTTRDTRELHDVPARLRHMDELGIETQILYPSLFLADVTRRPELNAALFHSYNRWIAERCADSKGRLRWIALIPFGAPDEARAELEFAKENGACGVFKRAVEGGRSIGDPYFFPLFEQTADLGLPLCIHQHREWLPIGIFLSSIWLGEQETSKFPVLTAFSSLIQAKIPQRIPNLRVGFIESASAWLPYLMYIAGYDAKSRDFETGLSLADYRFYVTCEVREDVGYLINAVGGDSNLIIGTDYSHADKSSIINAHRLLLERDDLDKTSATKITSENARALYGL